MGRPSPDRERATPIGDVERALRRLAGGASGHAASITVGARAIDRDDIGSLHPVELEAVARAVPKRQREFATGRALLRELLGTTEAIPVNRDRSPDWPPGVVGSLAHDRSVAVAAVATDARIRALGIDVEPDDPLTPEMSAAILRHDERELDAHLAFALKEAAYKAWSTLGGPILDHHDVRVRLLGDDDHRSAGVERFSAEVVDTTFGTTFGGMFCRTQGRFLVLVIATDN